MTAADGDLSAARVHRPALLKAPLLERDIGHAIAFFGDEPHTFNDVAHERTAGCRVRQKVDDVLEHLAIFVGGQETLDTLEHHGKFSPNSVYFSSVA